MIRDPHKRLEDSLTKDNLWLYILTLLSEKEHYPYELRDEIKKRFGFTPGNVTSYVVLYKLISQGYVKKGKRVVEKGPERTYFKISNKGKKELKKGKDILRKYYRIFIKRKNNF